MFYQINSGLITLLLFSAHYFLQFGNYQKKNDKLFNLKLILLNHI